MRTRFWPLEIVSKQESDSDVYYRYLTRGVEKAVDHITYTLRTFGLLVCFPCNFCGSSPLACTLLNVSTESVFSSYSGHLSACYCWLLCSTCMFCAGQDGQCRRPNSPVSCSQRSQVRSLSQNLAWFCHVKRKRLRYKWDLPNVAGPHRYQERCTVVDTSSVSKNFVFFSFCNLGLGIANRNG